MKIRIVICLLAACFSATLHAQSKEAAEKKFTSALNTILSSTSSFHFNFEDKFTIDSPFAIKQGILSVTLKFTNDTSAYRIRVAAPVNTIRHVGWDIYIILECRRDAVTYYYAGKGESLFAETGKTNLFHIGAVDKDGEAIMNSLNKQLELLKELYK